MKITFNWLKKHMNFYEGNIIKLLENLELTLIKLGLELEGHQLLNPILSVKIVSCEKIDDINNNSQVCKITIPKGLEAFFAKKDLSVVCGAKNVREGMICAFCPASTIVNSYLVEEKKIFGVVSEGIFLGIEGTNEILELTGEGIHKLEDVILDISVPTNRWDLKNVRALARNLCFFGLGTLKDLQIKTDNKSVFPFEVQNSCNTLASFVCVNGISVTEEVTSLMKIVGLESNNSLQILNDFIVRDIGHPIHIYDKRKISSILIDRVEANITVQTLSGYFTTEGNEILIKSNENILAVGGMIGCEGYDLDTKDVVIEAVYFEPSDISRVINDTSKVFSLGIDCHQPTLPYVCTLIKGDLSNIHWSGHKRNTDLTLRFSNDFLYSQTGLSLSLNKCKGILEDKGFVCTVVKNKKENSVTEKFEIEVIPPTWRRDVKEEFSIGEEIIKTLGYEVIESAENEFFLNNHMDSISRIKLFLCDRGYVEYIGSPFSTSGSILITNPLQSNRGYLRDNLIESLTDVAKETFAKGEILCKIFEIGKIYPTEEEQVAILFCGNPRKNFYTQEKASFFQFKELIYSMSNLLDIQELDSLENQVNFTNGFIRIIYLPKIKHPIFYAQFSLNKSHKKKNPPLRYNYKNVSIEFKGKWQDFKKRFVEFSCCEFLLSDIYENTYTITIKYPYGYDVDKIIEKIK